MKPLVKYRGGKSREIPQILEHLPAFQGRYIEPFFGGGALFFYLCPARAIINDINSKLIDFYLGVKNDFEHLKVELDEVQAIYEQNHSLFIQQKELNPTQRVENKNEQFYYQLRDMFNDLTPKKYSEALLYFFINKTAYSGMIRYNAKGEFNVPFGRYPHLNTALVTVEHHQLLSRAQIFNKDYKRIFQMAKPDDFMFLDPPYDCVFSDYGNEEYKDGFNEACHIALAEEFRNLKCKALLVIGKTPLTEKLYAGMIVDQYGKKYAVNIRNRFQSAASHILVTNFESQRPNLFSTVQDSDILFV